MNCEETFPVETTRKHKNQQNSWTTNVFPVHLAPLFKPMFGYFWLELLDAAYMNFKPHAVSPCVEGLASYQFLSLLITESYTEFYVFPSSCCAWSRISHWQTPFLRSICSNPWPTQRMGKIRDQWHLTPLSTLCNYKPSRERVALPNFTGQLSVPVVESFSVVLLSLLKHFLFSRFTHFAANFYIIVVSFCLQMEGQSQVKANAFARP